MQLPTLPSLPFLPYGTFTQMATALTAEVSAHLRDYLRQALSHFNVRAGEALDAFHAARDACRVAGFLHANGTLLVVPPYPPEVEAFKRATRDYLHARDGARVLGDLVKLEWVDPAWAQRLVPVVVRRLYDQDAASGLGDPVGLADDRAFVLAMEVARGPAAEEPVVPLAEDGEPIYPAASAEYVPPPPARVVTRSVAAGGRRPAAAPGALHWH